MDYLVWIDFYYLWFWGVTPILCFSRGSRHYGLFLGLPWYEKITQKDTITCGWPPGINARGPISICVGLQMEIWSSW